LYTEPNAPFPMYDFIVKKSSGFDGIESMSPKEGFVDFLSKFFDDILNISF
jgi:hypothetical protein